MVKPPALVLLGATAAQALLGSHIRIGRDRGHPIDSELADLVTITTHPSAILRAQDDERDRPAMDAVRRRPAERRAMARLPSRHGSLTLSDVADGPSR